jgi:CheY-like chemotaxis protein
MTAFSTPDVAQQALELGAVRVVGKPFEMGEIVRLVQQVR